MNIPSEKRKERYTYADYLNWRNDERWEIIGGEPYLMSPAPSSEHQRILMEIASQLHTYLRGKNCTVFPAPFDVRLSQGEEKDDETENVVQPDLVVVCDRDKIDKRGCKGAPDLIIEILSYSTAKKDLNDKFNLYEQTGVKEYWVVFQGEEVVEVYQLNDSKRYEKSGTYHSSDQIKVGILPELEIDLSLVFQNRIV
ncbi:MAG: Uma2 family endonuclease [Methanocorpusculum sp.]|nr:Uma2 family endonuclease [Methanocorpusculum sp.]MDD4563083.1 Uma2 family endonuclease [Syntrophomonadaceae bacterium]